MKNFNFLPIALFLFFGSIAHAQSAIYVCSTTGAYGFCYGTTDVEECAYNKCLQYGGKSPKRGGFVSDKGYGAVAIGKTSTGGQAVGFAAGYSTQEEADQVARNYCTQYGGQYPHVDARFLDQ